MANNANAFESLNAKIEALKKLKHFSAAVAPKVAKALETELQGQISRGQDPSGKTWKKTEKGLTPLQNAGSELTVQAIGSVVVATLKGHSVWHHRGQTRGNITRQVLPSRKLSAPIVEAITKVIQQEMKDLGP